MKTNKELVAYCKAQLGKPYWFGTFGQIATDKLLAEKASQYSRQYSAKRQGIAKEKHLGFKVHDCYGLYKGFLMSASPLDPAVYNKEYDIGADAAFNRSTEKGTIDTIPADIEGIGLWKKGHFGVYIGGGQEIEARGFDYGVVQDAVENTNFTHWFKMPEIEYVEEEEADKPSIPHEDASNSSSNTSDDKIYIVQKGDSLSKIGAKYGVSVSDLVEWNKIEKPDFIQIGQKIIVKSIKPKSNEPLFFEGRVTTNRLPLNIRKGATLDSPAIGCIPKGTIIKIAYETAGWGKLYGNEGFVSMAFVTKL